MHSCLLASILTVAKITIPAHCFNSTAWFASPFCVLPHFQYKLSFSLWRLCTLPSLFQYWDLICASAMLVFRLKRLNFQIYIAVLPLKHIEQPGREQSHCKLCEARYYQTLLCLYSDWWLALTDSWSLVNRVYSAVIPMQHVLVETRLETGVLETVHQIQRCFSIPPYFSKECNIYPCSPVS